MAMKFVRSGVSGQSILNVVVGPGTHKGCHYILLINS